MPEKELNNVEKDVYDKVFMNLLQTTTHIQEYRNKTLKPFGVSEAQYLVLQALFKNRGKFLIMKDINALMMHENSNTTRLVDKLIDKGYVIRSLNKVNRRVVGIAITESGLITFKNAQKVYKTNRAIFQELISETEATALSYLLTQLRS